MKMNIMQRLAYGALVALTSDKSTTNVDMAMDMGKKLMKKDDVKFLVKRFESRYHIKHGVYIEPTVDPETLNVSKWKLMLGSKVLQEASSFDELMRVTTEAVLTLDEDKITAVTSKLI